MRCRRTWALRCLGCALWWPVWCVGGGCNSRLNLVRLFKTPPHPARACAPPYTPVRCAPARHCRLAGAVCCAYLCAVLCARCARCVCVPVLCAVRCVLTSFAQSARLPLLRAVCAVCAVCRMCRAVPGSTWRCSALLPLLCRDPESPGTAPTLAARRAGAQHAALLYASVTIKPYV